VRPPAKSESHLNSWIHINAKAPECSGSRMNVRLFSLPGRLRLQSGITAPWLLLAAREQWLWRFSATSFLLRISYNKVRKLSLVRSFTTCAAVSRSAYPCAYPTDHPHELKLFSVRVLLLSLKVGEQAVHRSGLQVQGRRAESRADQSNSWRLAA